MSLQLIGFDNSINLANRGSFFLIIQMMTLLIIHGILLKSSNRRYYLIKGSPWRISSMMDILLLQLNNVIMKKYSFSNSGSCVVTTLCPVAYNICETNLNAFWCDGEHFIVFNRETIPIFILGFSDQREWSKDVKARWGFIFFGFIFL